MESSWRDTSWREPSLGVISETDEADEFPDSRELRYQFNLSSSKVEDLEATIEQLRRERDDLKRLVRLGMKKEGNTSQETDCLDPVEVERLIGRIREKMVRRKREFDAERRRLKLVIEQVSMQRDEFQAKTERAEAELEASKEETSRLKQSREKYLEEAKRWKSKATELQVDIRELRRQKEEMSQSFLTKEKQFKDYVNMTTKEMSIKASTEIVHIKNHLQRVSSKKNVAECDTSDDDSSQQVTCSVSDRKAYPCNTAFAKKRHSLPTDTPNMFERCDLSSMDCSDRRSVVPSIKGLWSTTKRSKNQIFGKKPNIGKMFTSCARQSGTDSQLKEPFGRRMSTSGDETGEVDSRRPHPDRTFLPWMKASSRKIIVTGDDCGESEEKRRSGKYVGKDFKEALLGSPRETLGGKSTACVKDENQASSGTKLSELVNHVNRHSDTSTDREGDSDSYETACTTGTQSSKPRLALARASAA